MLVREGNIFPSLMKTIKGVDVDKSYLCSLLCDICCVCITIDYERKSFTVSVKDKCSSEISVTWSDIEAKCDYVKINDFLRKCYSENVTVFFVPDIPFSDNQIGSMAQAIADRAKELTNEFAEELRSEVYTLSKAQLYQAASR